MLVLYFCITIVLNIIQVSVVKENKLPLNTSITQRAKAKFQYRTFSDSINHDYYWNQTCPFLSTSYDGVFKNQTQRAEEARIISLKSGATKKIRSALDSGVLAGRKVLLMGDSLHKQMYQSLNCMAGEERTGPYFHKPQKKMGRSFLKSGPSPNDWLQVFFNYDAGNLVELNAGAINGIHWEEQQSWIDACEAGEPFYFRDACIRDAPQHDECKANNESSKIALGSDDFVFLYKTKHARKEENLENIVALARCMQSARRNGTNHPDWPIFSYTVTQPTHWATKGGLYDRNHSTDNPCATFSHSKETERMNQEVNTVEGLFPIVGRDSFLKQTALGKYHMDNGDCTHWMLPGVQDLVSREIVEWMLETATKENAIINIQ
mmetsp:Transcript_17078/g.23738  ORF Transcript_17078/g.23738 Transcript_17078/m.23738 type:complete len:378 (+) Transcript_17078:3-1136(+)